MNGPCVTDDVRARTADCEQRMRHEVAHGQNPRTDEKLRFEFLRRSAKKTISMALLAERERQTKNVFRIALRI